MKHGYPEGLKMVKELPRRISLTRRQRKILERFAGGRKCPQGLFRRVKIILCWGEGWNISRTAKELEVDFNAVCLWRRRWLDFTNRLTVQGEEQCEHKVLRDKICEALSDATRSGAPAKFSAEVVCQVIALACKSPEELGLPLSHWSAADLRRQALKHGIVNEISARTVGRFLKGCGLEAASKPVLAELGGQTGSRGIYQAFRDRLRDLSRGQTLA
jgi:putative transposase